MGDPNSASAAGDGESKIDKWIEVMTKLKALKDGNVTKTESKTETIDWANIANAIGTFGTGLAT